MESNSEQLKAVLAIVLASFLWGTTGTAASFAPDISSFAIGAFAMGIAGFLLVLTARYQLLKDYKLMLTQRKVLLCGALSVAIYPLAFYSSMRLSGVAIGTVISIASAPFFAVMLERLISKKKVSLQWMISFVIGTVGIVLLVAGREHHQQMSGNIFQQHIGIILGCVAGLTYASYSWATRSLIEKGVDSQSAMSGLFGFAAILLLPSLLFTGEHLFSSVTNSFVSLYMAIIPMFVGYLLFAFGLKSIDASKATLITLIEPLVATLLAIFIVKESFAPIGILGMVLVSLCIFLQVYKKRPVQSLTIDFT